MLLSRYLARFLLFIFKNGTITQSSVERDCVEADSRSKQTGILLRMAKVFGEDIAAHAKG